MIVENYKEQPYYKKKMFFSKLIDDKYINGFFYPNILTDQFGRYLEFYIYRGFIKGCSLNYTGKHKIKRIQTYVPKNKHICNETDFFLEDIECSSLDESIVNAIELPSSCINEGIRIKIYLDEKETDFTEVKEAYLVVKFNYKTEKEVEEYCYKTENPNGLLIPFKNKVFCIKGNKCSSRVYLSMIEH